MTDKYDKEVRSRQKATGEHKSALSALKGSSAHKALEAKKEGKRELPTKELRHLFSKHKDISKLSRHTVKKYLG